MAVEDDWSKFPDIVLISYLNAMAAHDKMKCVRAVKYLIPGGKIKKPPAGPLISRTVSSRYRGKNLPARKDFAEFPAISPPAAIN